MSIKIEISVGELLDKVSILEIKQERINDREKLKNIEKEHSVLSGHWHKSPYASVDLKDEIVALKKVNEELWDIEDNIRLKEKEKKFDDEFIELARAVYFTNDKRADIKHKINNKTGSVLVEEKSYSDYA